jgi:hypothetical protein
MEVMSKAATAIEGIYKTYLYKTMVKDLSKFAKKAWANRDDAEFFLHKIGLEKYSPVKSAIGAFSVLVLGAVCGGALALFLAPMRGEELREEIGERAKSFVGGVRSQAQQQAGAQA